MNICIQCELGLDEIEESIGQISCFDCTLKAGTQTQKEIFNLKKQWYKGALLAQLEDCEFNGAGMRQLIDEFCQEVLGH